MELKSKISIIYLKKTIMFIEPWFWYFRNDEFEWFKIIQVWWWDYSFWSSITDLKEHKYRWIFWYNKSHWVWAIYGYKLALWTREHCTIFLRENIIKISGKGFIYLFGLLNMIFFYMQMIYYYWMIFKISLVKSQKLLHNSLIWLILET